MCGMIRLFARGLSQQVIQSKIKILLCVFINASSNGQAWVDLHAMIMVPDQITVYSIVILKESDQKQIINQWDCDLPVIR